MSKVLVLDGNLNSSLAVVRSLGRQGIEVTVGAEVQPCLAGSSRYCTRHFVYPQPAQDSGQFIDFIFDEVRNSQYDFIFPVTDVTIPIILQHRHLFEKYTSLPFANYETYNFASDKFRLQHYAKNNGIPIPKTCFFDPQQQRLADCLAEIEFPAVVKPAFSKRVVNGKTVSFGVRYAHNTRELTEIVKQSSLPHNIPLLIQEKIHGEGIGLFALYRNGKAKMLFSHRRIREKPPSGGVSVICESIPTDPKVKEYGLRILNHLKWHGVAMVEFKKDYLDGIPYLMEINARFWGSLQLAIDSGADFPHELVKMLRGEDIPENLAGYKTGHRCKWLLGNLDYYYLLCKSRSCNMFVKSLKEELTLLRKRPTHFVCRQEDIRPFLLELKRYFVTA
jgi:predicted ATP-grasp superfamily ATP-dependent carboligase